MKLLHIGVILLFVTFAVVQLNDPDPYGWVTIYLGVAVTAGFYLANRDVRLISILGVVACSVGTLILIPDFINWLTHGMPSITRSMKAESPYIELVREFLGFLIAGSAYLLYFRSNLKRGKTT